MYHEVLLMQRPIFLSEILMMMSLFLASVCMLFMSSIVTLWKSVGLVFISLSCGILVNSLRVA